MTLLLFSVALLAMISFCSWWYCWRDVLGGKPGILSLRQITLIMDRNKLDTLYGKHGPGYRYTLNSHALAQITRWRRLFVYKEMFAELVVFTGAYRYVTGSASMESLAAFLLVAITYQVLSLWYSMRLVKGYWHQIEEEMDNNKPY